MPQLPCGSSLPSQCLLDSFLHFLPWSHLKQTPDNPTELGQRPLEHTTWSQAFMFRESCRVWSTGGQPFSDKPGKVSG